MLITLHYSCPKQFCIFKACVLLIQVEPRKNNSIFQVFCSSLIAIITTYSAKMLRIFLFFHIRWMLWKIL